MGNIFGDILDVIGGEGGKDALRDAGKSYNGISIPELKEYNPELYKQIVQLNPELEQNVVLGPSATEGISLDPRLRQAQLSALAKMQDISNNEGKDAQFLADANRARNDVNSNLQGNQKAIEQNMAARGLSGGMTEMVNRQISAQGAANRQAQLELDLHSQAQQRALTALMNQSNMANQMSQTDFNQQNTKAQAQDAISKFNAQNLQQVNSNNTAAKNNAQQWNAELAQNTQNQNTQTRNEQQLINNQIKNQNFNNQMNLANAKAGIYKSQAELEEERRKGNLGFAGGLINAGASAYAGGKK